MFFCNLAYSESSLCVVYGTDAQLAKDLSKDDVERVIVQLILDGILVACLDSWFTLFE